MFHFIKWKTLSNGRHAKNTEYPVLATNTWANLRIRMKVRVRIRVMESVIFSMCDFLDVWYGKCDFLEVNAPTKSRPKKKALLCTRQFLLQLRMKVCVASCKKKTAPWISLHFLAELIIIFYLTFIHLFWQGKLGKGARPNWSHILNITNLEIYF